MDSGQTGRITRSRTAKSANPVSPQSTTTDSATESAAVPSSSVISTSPSHPRNLSSPIASKTRKARSSINNSEETSQAGSSRDAITASNQPQPPQASSRGNKRGRRSIPSREEELSNVATQDQSTGSSSKGKGRASGSAVVPPAESSKRLVSIAIEEVEAAGSALLATR